MLDQEKKLGMKAVLGILAGETNLYHKKYIVILSAFIFLGTELSPLCLYNTD